MNRMDRRQFYEALAPLGSEALKKALWNLYWRGSAPMRERIEAELAPAEAKKPVGRPKLEIDAAMVHREVVRFAELARCGAYLGGDRRVTPRERTRWRFTFGRLAADARLALCSDDIEPGAEAMEKLIDLACELRYVDYFRSEDPVEAARLVVSDAVALLWLKVRDHLGFPAFAKCAAAQLLKWESPYGWTRTGFGSIRQKEQSLATVVTPLLPTIDAWIFFADCYLHALGQAAKDAPAQPGWGRGVREPTPRERAGALGEWHHLLLDRLLDSGREDVLEALARHPALGGPELVFFQAKLAHRRGDADSARELVYRALEELPGHRNFLAFAADIDAPLPARAQQVAAMRGG
jgi:hypothetical protein